MGLWSYGLVADLLSNSLVVLCSVVASLWSYVLVVMVLCCGVYIIDPGQLVTGHSYVSEDAHLAGIGNTIRMVMSHYIELKRCEVAKTVAFRKASL